MRGNGIFKLAALATLLAAAALPASAGPYSVASDVIRGAQVKGTITAGFGRTGTATMSLVRHQTTQAFGLFQVLPAGGAPESTVDPDYPGGVIGYEGCVSIKIGSMRDSGCVVKGPAATLDIDPSFEEATVIYTIRSSKYEGRYIWVTLLLAADGSPTPTVEPGDTTVTPGPPFANTLESDLQAFVSRPMNVVAGSVRSESIGGGPISSTTAGNVFMGLHAPGSISTACPVKLGGNCAA